MFIHLAPEVTTNFVPSAKSITMPARVRYPLFYLESPEGWSVGEVTLVCFCVPEVSAGWLRLCRPRCRAGGQTTNSTQVYTTRNVMVVMYCSLFRLIVKYTLRTSADICASYCMHPIL